MASVLFCTDPAFAQTPINDSSVMRPIIVEPIVSEKDSVGDREWDPLVGEVEHSEFTGSRTFIGRESMPAESSSISRLIAHETGIQHRQSGGMGSYSSLTVRAGTTAQTNVYFDGILLNNAGSFGVDLSQFDLSSLEGIDVYRSATPVQLGIAAIGGAVNLRSRKQEGDEASLRLGIGSFNSRQFNLNQHRKRGAFDSTFVLALKRSDNNFELLNKGGTPLNTADDVVERRNNAKFSQDSLLFKLGYEPSRESTRGLRYDGVFQLTQRAQGVPHWRNLDNNSSSFATDTLQFQLNRRVDAVGDSNWNNNNALFVNTSRETYDDRYSQIGLAAQLNKARTEVLGVRSYWENVGDLGTLALNLESRIETREQIDHVTLFESSAQRLQFDAALHYAWFTYDERLLLTPSVRVQALGDKYNGVLREGSHSHKVKSVVFQLGSRWQHNDTLQFAANIGQYKREPLFFELFGDRGLFFGNASLKAEEGINADAAVTWSSADGLANLVFSAYTGIREKLIVTSYDARGIGRSLNSGKARITGLESALNWKLSNNLETRLNVTLQSAKNLSDASGITDKELPGEAGLSAFGQLKYVKHEWSLWYEFNAVNDRFFDSANLLPADDTLIHNAGIALTRSGFAFVALFNNLADDTAQDFNGFQKPGRSYDFSLEYTF